MINDYLVIIFKCLKIKIHNGIGDNKRKPNLMLNRF